MSGSFSRGRDEIQANASLTFVGNINVDIETAVRTSHLFTPFPKEMQDLALLDRLHAYLPGWELPLADDVAIALHRGLPTRQEVGLGFEVDDLEAACDLATANGGAIADPPKQREREGIRRADVLDPAGNRSQSRRGSGHARRAHPVGTRLRGED